MVVPFHWILAAVMVADAFMAAAAAVAAAILAGSGVVVVVPAVKEGCGLALIYGLEGSVAAAVAVVVAAAAVVVVPATPGIWTMVGVGLCFPVC